MSRIQRYRKKPVVIEAVRWDFDGFTNDELEAVLRWLDGSASRIVPANAEPEYRGTLYINTLEGRMECRPGDWIIKGVKGEFYPCKPDIFAATYEPTYEPAHEQEAP